MKRILCLWCTFVFFAVVGCSSDKDVMEDDSLNEEMFLLQANLAPEFSEGYNSFRDQTTTNIENNRTEITRDCNGCVTHASFRNTPIKDRPSTPAEFVSIFLGGDFTKKFQQYRQQQDENGLIHEWYRQYYKDIEVEGKGFVFHYSKEDRIHSVNGSYLPVNDLDVRPAFSADTARKIYAKYLNKPLEYAGLAILYIVEFPLSAESELWAPRLVYKLCVASVDGEPYLSDEGQCYIDAKTGRILYVWPNYKLDKF